MEEWKAIPGYEGLYEVSNKGEIKSLARWKQTSSTKTPYWIPERILYQHKAPHGYMMACLSKNGDTRTCSVHRLMLNAFVGEPPLKYDACHNNGIRDDNRLENLRWDTRVNNFKDRERHGNTAKGSKNGMAKIDEQAVKEILASQLSNRQIAKKHGLSSVSVDNIKNRTAWSHVETEVFSPTVKNRRAGMKGDTNSSAKLDADKVKAIRDDNRTSSQIAKDYGVSRTAICWIKSRRTWKHI